MDRRAILMSSVMSAMTLFQTFAAALLLEHNRNTQQFLTMSREVCRRRMIRKHVQQLLMFMRVQRKPRRMWKRDRSHEWWNVTVANFDDDQWLENFRVRKATFNLICDGVRDVLAPQDNQVMKDHALSVEKIVAIALYKLAHVAEYKIVANQFGVHKSTVHNCVYAFCRAITDVMSEKYIFMPDRDEARAIADRFEARTNVPQMIGAIDGSHIPITPPSEGHADFVNRKGGTSLILQAVVDDQYVFRDISCKCVGACHDADALRASNFYKKIDTNMPKGVKNVDGMDIPFFIAGDPAYPLQPWLIKAYNYTRHISPQMDSFNVHLNSGRVVVENAFGRLKGRWRILLKRTEIHHTFVPTMVAACCILHNICEMSRETFIRKWLDEDGEPDCEDLEPEIYDADDEPEGADVRDHLCWYLARNFELRESIRGRYAVL